MAVKCRECGCPTKNTEWNEDETAFVSKDICWNCMIIVQMIRAFEEGISLHQPPKGKPRKLEITSYKITRI